MNAMVAQPAQDQAICGINKFLERDIDLLLAEELRVNETFGEWMMGQLGLTDHVVCPAIHTNVSVIEDGSEADVVATFVARNGGHHRVFIENKIDAILMPEQLQRYMRRGEGEQRRGLVTAFSVVFFTPSAYLRTELPIGVTQISFESAALAIETRPASLRSDYRASLLRKALPLRSISARDASVAESDPYIKAWWDAVYVMLEREYPGFFVHRTRYPRSVYFAPSTPDQASYLRVDFKGHKGEVDLAFKDVPASALGALLSGMPSFPGRIVANGRSSAIQIAGLRPFVISEGCEVIETSVRSAYAATHTLLAYWKAHQATFDRFIANHR